MHRLSRFLALPGLLVAAGSARGQRLEPLRTMPRHPDVMIGQVTDLDVLPDGGVVVLDQLSHAVLVFDAAGALRATLGREGAGPGELAGAAELEVGPAGEIAVLDYRNLRITVWAVGGTLLRTVPLQSLAGSAGAWPHELLWEPGGAWLKLSRFTPGAPVVVLRLAPDLTRTRDTAVSFVAGAEGVATCLFCPIVATPRGDLAAARGDTSYAVALLDGAGRATATWVRRDLPAARRSAERVGRLGRAGRRMAAAEGGRAGADISPYAARFVPKSLGFDGRGRLWALPSAEEGGTTIDVFARPGAVPTTLRLAAPLFGFRIRGDRLVGIGEGPNGEPVVHVLRIVE